MYHSDNVAPMKRPTRKQMVSFKLSSPARSSLTRISKKQGWTKTLVMENALKRFEHDLKQETAGAR